MFSLFESYAYPIGIDVGAHAIRLLQFKKGGEGLALQAACRIELESVDSAGSDRLSAAVRHALTSQNFAGKRVVLSLPVSSVNAKSVRLPQMPDSDLTQALQWEAKDRFGFEVGDQGGNAGQLVWFRAGEVRRGTEVKDELLLFAVNGELLNTHVQCLTNAGLQIAAIDLAPCANFRSARRVAPALGSGTGAILDLGHDGSQLLITRDDELIFYKHIEIGGKAINAAIGSKLGISVAEAGQMRSRLTLDSTAAADAAPLNQALRDAMRAPLEELARELDMCMRYYVVTFRGSRPETLLLTGRQSSCPQVHEVLAAALNIQVEEAQALRGVQGLGDTARPDRSGEWSVAAGLSLYPVHGQRAGVAA